MEDETLHDLIHLLVSELYQWCIYIHIEWQGNNFTNYVLSMNDSVNSHNLPLKENDLTLIRILI